MIVGQTLFKMDGNPYVTNWIPRMGNAAIFTLEVTHIANSPTATVTVEHKNYADTSWTSAGAFGSITAVGFATVNLSGLKEQVRIAIAVAGASAVSGIHIIIGAPSWRYY